ncbi:unnamed protein product [Dibothriocephalus latus]|uniref:Uncharacterized protein n=1 Tax=Dibothriocephalus latus TaxID=60516 RepID=A0A3P6TXT0_DIBLA|nr:unnamed protein product [Dibothriocephalus latus]
MSLPPFILTDIKQRRAGWMTYWREDDAKTPTLAYHFLRFLSKSCLLSIAAGDGGIAAVSKQYPLRAAVITGAYQGFTIISVEIPFGSKIAKITEQVAVGGGGNGGTIFRQYLPRAAVNFNFCILCLTRVSALRPEVFWKQHCAYNSARVDTVTGVTVAAAAAVAARSKALRAKQKQYPSAPVNF